MALKKVAPHDELFAEILKLYKELGSTIAEYEAKTSKRNRVRRKKVALIDPRTGRPFKARSAQ